MTRTPQGPTSRTLTALALTLLTAACTGARSRAPFADESAAGPTYGALSEPIIWHLKPEGGSYTAGIVTLTVPPGAIANEVEVTVTSEAPLQLGTEHEDVIAADLVFAPAGLTFQRPVQAALLLPQLDEDDQPTIYWTREGSSDVELLESVHDGSTLTFEIEHFSRRNRCRRTRHRQQRQPGSRVLHR